MGSIPFANTQPMIASQHKSALPFWQHLTEKEREQISASAVTINLGAQTTVFEAHHDSSFIMYVVYGNVKLCRNSYDDREIILRIVGPGQFISFQALISNSEMREYEETISYCTLIKIPAVDIRKIISENWHVSEFFINQLGARYNRMADRFTQTHQSVFIRKHVVDLILELADDIGRKVGDEILIDHGLTQHQLASLIHRTRQSVTVVLSQMKRENLINYTRTSILIRDIEALIKWGLQKPIDDQTQ